VLRLSLDDEQPREYVDGLERCLAVQMSSLQELSEMARGFSNHLAQEDALSKQFNARWHEEEGAVAAQ
jgi:hypothetical protein